MTATLVLSADQIVSLFQQLDPQSKRVVLYQLAEAAGRQRLARMALAETRLRQRACERGLEWETMSELQREAFIDDLVHEDR